MGFIIKTTLRQIRNNSAGVPVSGYRSVFGDIANCLNYTTYLCDQEFNVQAALQFSQPDSNDPAARPPKPDDPDFAEKQEVQRGVARMRPREEKLQCGRRCSVVALWVRT